MFQARIIARIKRFMLLLMLAGLAVPPSTAVRAQPRPAPAAPVVFPYGVSWYPEWVAEDSWDADLRMMKSAGITYVRLAEFSWSSLEPSEGNYDFGWLDRALARVAAHGMKAMLGTPTAAPPAWLTQKYPDTLVVDASGKRVDHGGRRHGSLTSVTYRLKAAQIADAMGKRYGRNPVVIGFQIDNEYGRKTFDDATKQQFRDWVQARYTSLDRLNAAWFGTYWSRTYSDWAQIGIPEGKFSNPPMWLDWLRFHSDVVRAYQAVQIAALRPHLSPDKIITHNYVAMYDDFDFGTPAQDLDVVGWDYYYEGARVDPAEGAMLHGLYRGFLGRNPWVIEASPINIVYVERNHAPPRGQVRAMVWQSIGQGADSYAFWLWQTPRGGNEPLHGSLVDAQRRPRPTFGEIAQAGREIARVWPRLRGTEPVAEVAMLHDYDGRWMIKREPLTIDYDPWKAFVGWHRAFAPKVGGIAVLRGHRDLARYKMVIAPNLPVIEDAAIAALTAYVRGGGHLVLGPRSGTRDMNAQVREPGAFDAMIGGRVVHYEAPSKPLALSGTLGSAIAKVWGERVEIEQADAVPLLSWDATDGYLDGGPAVITRPFGKGRITYVGAWLDDSALGRVAAWAAARANTSPPVPSAPEGVEIAVRGSATQRVLTAVNWSDAITSFALPRPMTDLFSGKPVSQVTLAPRDVILLADEMPR